MSAVVDRPMVSAVSRDDQHRFSKQSHEAILLLAGVGVEGDAHAGKTVKHRSRVKADPSQPNLRQVHLIHAELLDELREKGFAVEPGTLGENVLTQGIDLLALPRDSLLRLGRDAVVRVTGLRNPCGQLDGYQAGLTRAVLDRTPDGELIRRCGIMGVVVSGGEVRPGDRIAITLPATPHQRLECV